MTIQDAETQDVIKLHSEHKPWKPTQSQKADVTLQTNDGQKPIDVAKASVKDLLKAPRAGPCASRLLPEGTSISDTQVQVPGKRKAAALDKSTDSDCRWAPGFERSELPGISATKTAKKTLRPNDPRLHLFEPMSATELAVSWPDLDAFLLSFRARVFFSREHVHKATKQHLKAWAHPSPPPLKLRRSKADGLPVTTKLSAKKAGCLLKAGTEILQDASGGVQHLHMKTAPAEAKSIAQDRGRLNGELSD